VIPRRHQAEARSVADNRRASIEITTQPPASTPSIPAAREREACFARKAGAPRVDGETPEWDDLEAPVLMT
jgi:hypothetical protein